MKLKKKNYFPKNTAFHCPFFVLIRHYKYLLGMKYIRAHTLDPLGKLPETGIKSETYLNRYLGTFIVSCYSWFCKRSEYMKGFLCYSG